LIRIYIHTSTVYIDIFRNIGMSYICIYMFIHIHIWVYIRLQPNLIIWRDSTYVFVDFCLRVDVRVPTNLWSPRASDSSSSSACDSGCANELDRLYGMPPWQARKSSLCFLDHGSIAPITMVQGQGSGISIIVCECVRMWICVCMYVRAYVRSWICVYIRGFVLGSWVLKTLLWPSMRENAGKQVLFPILFLRHFRH